MQLDGGGAVPPDTVRLVAEVGHSSPAGIRWLRILGDDTRGYLLVGDLEPPDMPPITEYWHASLDLALGAAEAVGIPRSAWDLEIRPPHPRPAG
jgi:hypothetical protein